MIVITGAGRGIGLHLAEKLTESGEEVLGISRTGTSVSSSFELLSADVGDFDALRSISRLLTKKGSQVNALINAAGVARMNLAIMTPPSSVREMVETNLMGTIFASQVFSPLMIRAGGGRIINFSTIAVPLGLSGESIYAASKAGVECFSRVLARELSSHQITVNCISPGPIDTDLIRNVPASKIQDIVNQQISKKQCDLVDIENLVKLLLDSKSSSITGEVLHVGGV